jgi:hypothetical protein
MKKIIFLLGIMTCAAMLFAQSDDSPFMTKSLSNENVKKVHVETSGGAIAVEAAGTAQSRIEVYVRANGGINNKLNKEEIQQRLNEDYELTVSVNNNELTAVAKPKNRVMNWKKGLNISFKIYVAPQVDTRLSTSGGSITINGLSGLQDFSTSGGSLHVGNISGTIHGRTSGGSIALNDSKGDIDLATSGGSITSTGSEGNIKLHTSGGSLTFHDLKGKIESSTSGGSISGDNISGALEAHTSGGSINLKDLTCSLETSTSGGHIAVELNELGKYVRIKNSGGNIALSMPGNKGMNLDLHGKVSADRISNFSGRQDNNSMTGTLNGGGIPVNVSAGGGRISLSLR